MINKTNEQGHRRSLGLPEKNSVRMEKTQQEWIPYWNEKKTLMFSAPDQYKAFKGNDKELQKSLKQDMKKSWIVSGSQIDYSKNTITHYVGSKWAYTIKVKIPVLQGDWEENKENEAYLQALFDTKDNISTIKAVMEKMADRRTIRLWTPSQSDRANRPLRSVVFFYGDFDGRFVVIGDGWFDGNVGLSRGVSVVGKKNSSGNVTIIKSNKAIFDFEKKTITIPFSKKLRDEIKRRKKKKIVWKFRIK